MTWKIIVWEQSVKKKGKFKPWCAMATRKVGNQVEGFNIEGMTADDARRRAEERIRNDFR